jgi:hypothetical protein
LFFRSSAAETAWTLSSAEMHRLLTVDRGWSGDQYEDWLGESLILLLLRPPARNSLAPARRIHLNHHPRSRS